MENISTTHNTKCRLASLENPNYKKKRDSNRKSEQKQLPPPRILPLLSFWLLRGRSD